MHLRHFTHKPALAENSPVGLLHVAPPRLPSRPARPARPSSAYPSRHREPPRGPRRRASRHHVWLVPFPLYRCPSDPGMFSSPCLCCWLRLTLLAFPDPPVRPIIASRAPLRKRTDPAPSSSHQPRLGSPIRLRDRDPVPRRHRHHPDERSRDTRVRLGGEPLRPHANYDYALVPGRSIAQGASLAPFLAPHC